MRGCGREGEERGSARGDSPPGGRHAARGAEMRAKRTRDARRVARQVRTRFGLLPPFKVLVDGGVVEEALKRRLGALQDVFAKFLGCVATPCVTKCVLNELREQKDTDDRGTFIAARRLQCLRCPCTKPVGAHECMRAMVGDSNPEGLFVASQNRELRNALSKVRATPTMFLGKHGLVLPRLSDAQLGAAAEEHAIAAGLSAVDKKAVMDAQRAAAEAAAANERTFKKKAKGPNPLAVKKKVAKPVQQQQQQQAQAPAKRKRTRKRRRGGGKSQPDAAGVSVADVGEE